MMTAQSATIWANLQAFRIQKWLCRTENGFAGPKALFSHAIRSMLNFLKIYRTEQNFTGHVLRSCGFRKDCVVVSHFMCNFVVSTKIHTNFLLCTILKFNLSVDKYLPCFIILFNVFTDLNESFDSVCFSYMKVVFKVVNMLMYIYIY